ncbi:MAG: hypothetical protein L0Y67_04410 [Gammaproteobacteria bacterium]|nr:hypothetical protein [Gammaproteobacteria bacterium]MCI0590833.1 hypothetical protein [Gammaproteobacteria bacterium]
MPDEPRTKTELAEQEGSIVMGMVWMGVISLLLFWLPAIGSLLAGIIGGKVAGGVSAGLIAALLPSILFGIILFIFATSLTGLPLVGALAGAGGLVLALSHVGMLLLGAIIGGLLA